MLTLRSGCYKLAFLIVGEAYWLLCTVVVKRWRYDVVVMFWCCSRLILRVCCEMLALHAGCYMLDMLNGGVAVWLLYLCVVKC